jgi:hypothetical protein
LDCKRQIKDETTLAFFGDHTVTLVRIKTIVRPNFGAELLHDGDDKPKHHPYKQFIR